MAKIIVNIISKDDLMPAYLFVKEKYEEGDGLMFISAKDTTEELALVSELLKVSSQDVVNIVLTKERDEFTYERIGRRLLPELRKDVKYCVNLAGGTRYLALAVQHVFESFDSEFFYTEVDNNYIVNSKFDDSFEENDDFFFPIRHQVTVAEYFNVHGVQNRLEAYRHAPDRPEKDALNFFELFSKHRIASDEYEIISILRENYRGRKYLKIAEAESPRNDRWARIPGLQRFLDRIGFTPKEKGKLLREELDYLTGGWFEEYVYYQLKRYANPFDIVINPKVSTKGVKRQNELDVAFTKNNKLYVVECKTGVHSESLFNEIIYKSCALKEAMFGLSCESYIFSLKKDDTGDLKKAAKCMDITFWDNAVLTNPSKFRKLMKNSFL